MSKNKTNTTSCSELRLKLKQQLESHDWFYQYSDDNRYYESGEKEYKEIWRTIEEIEEFGENEFDIAIDMFKAHKPVINTPHEKVIGKNY